MLNEYEPSGSQTWLQEQTDVKLKRALYTRLAKTRI